MVDIEIVAGCMVEHMCLGLIEGRYFGCDPLPVTVANKGLKGSPTQNGIILVAILTPQQISSNHHCVGLASTGS